MATTTATTTRAASTSPSRLWTLHPPSTRLQTVHSLLAAYSELTPAALTEHLDDSFTHQVLPTSLSMPIRDLTAFAAHASQITKIFTAFAMVPKFITEDARKNEVVVYADMIGTLAFEDMSAVEREWRNECVLFLSMSRDGMKVIGMKEFVDSAKAKELRAILGERMEKKSVGKGDNGEVEEENPMAAAAAMAAAGQVIVVEGPGVVAEAKKQGLGFKTVDHVLAEHWRES